MFSDEAPGLSYAEEAAEGRGLAVFFSQALLYPWFMPVQRVSESCRPLLWKRGWLWGCLGFRVGPLRISDYCGGLSIAYLRTHQESPSSLTTLDPEPTLIPNECFD